MTTTNAAPFTQTRCGKRLAKILADMPPFSRGDDRGWNLYQLAAKSGLTQNCLWMIVDRGSRIPDADTILKICSAIGKNAAQVDEMVAEFVRLAAKDREERGERG